MLVAIDFEFFDSHEKDLALVAAVLTDGKLVKKFPLIPSMSSKEELITSLLKIKQKNGVLVGYATLAEARAIQSLGLNPMEFQWIDLYTEFLMLCNSNAKYEYGDYLQPDGLLGYSEPPSEDDEDEDTSNKVVPKNMINAVFKLLGVHISSKQKEDMRNLILSKDLISIEESIQDILEYCYSDTKYLLPLLARIKEIHEEEGIGDQTEAMLSRGRYVASTALCESQGLPINTNLLSKIIDKTPEILQVYKDKVNETFNYFCPEFQRAPIVRKNGKVFHYKKTEAKKDLGAYQRYVEGLHLSGFPLTKTGKYKSDTETLEEFNGDVGLNSLLMYNYTESSLKWFNRGNGNGFFERLGSDKNVRPFYGVFGTQTGRNAAKAKTFPLAMSKWLRVIINPDLGSYILSADFSQQEVYVAAILSGDKNLLDAYLSGDVYLDFAKKAGLAPMDATKKSHKAVRDLCKSTVLGLQYGMGVKKLQRKLCVDSGRKVTLEETQALVDAHKRVFSVYWDWVKSISRRYQKGYPLVTNDGWVLFQDNPSIPSVRNFLVQGNSASITRKAIVLGTERGLTMLCGLHDAIYVLSKDPEKDLEIVKDIMLESTRSILRETSTNIRIDTKVQAHGELWIEEAAQADWDKISKFLV